MEHVSGSSVVQGSNDATFTGAELAGGARAPHEAGAHLQGLLEAAQRGDRAALSALLAWARPRLFSVALRMVRDRDDAEDVVQEALVKICRHVGGFEQRAAFTTWLHRIATNAALDWMRRQKARVDHSLRAQAERERDREGEPRTRGRDAVDERTPELLLGGAEVDTAVQRAMRTLSPVHRDVLALREIDGASYLEIAETAGCPVGTVMSRLHHARRRLGEVLGVQRAELLPQAA